MKINKLFFLMGFLILGITNASFGNDVLIPGLTKISEFAKSFYTKK